MEPLLSTAEGVSCMELKLKEKKVMIFHLVKSLSYFLLLKVGHSVKGIMRGVGQLTIRSESYVNHFI